MVGLFRATKSFSREKNRLNSEEKKVNFTAFFVGVSNYTATLWILCNAAFIMGYESQTSYTYSQTEKSFVAIPTMMTSMPERVAV